MKVLLLLWLVEACTGFRILGFFPFPMKSHHLTYAPVIHELARRGHQVVYYTSVPTRLTHSNLDIREVENFKDKYLDALDVSALGSSPMPLAAFRFSEAALKTADLFYGSPQAQEIIHGNDAFDAVLMASNFAQEPVTALIHKFGCVAVELSSMGDIAWLNEMSGLPDNPAYQVDFKTTFSDKLTQMERLHNWYATWSTILVDYYHLWRMQSVMDHYFNYTGWESRPSIGKLLSNKSMILVNRHVVLNHPYPQAPHVKDIGGINLVENKPLPKDIQDLMDTSPKGVIYFSMGSNLNTSDIATGAFGEAFMAALSKLPQNVIMKWENERPKNFPSNIMTYKWLPQQDILAHNNCVLFITHCGYNSLMESVYHSVPVIGIPFFGDQFKNAKFLETVGIGVELRYENVSQSSVSWAINEVLTNERYKKEVSKRARILRERPRSAAEEAADWVEFSIKYPNALTPRAAFLSFLELHMIDVHLIILVTLIIVYKTIFLVCASFAKKESLKERLTSRGPVKKFKIS